jgi:diacylglycerol O-acyltransferase
MERLTPLAAAFLEAEDEDSRASLAIGSLAVFEGPAPPFEEFVETIAGRLPLIPRYRQRLCTVPFDLSEPVWADDPGFDLSRHVRRTVVPPPGEHDEIGRLVSRLMASRMDRSRPLWEYWFCEGLSGGRWALLSKLHHSLVDGVSGTDLYRLVLDPSPEPRPAEPDDWQPAPAPSTLSMTARGLVDLAGSPARTARAAVGAARRPRDLLSTAEASGRGLVAMAGALLPAQRSSLSGPLQGSRRYTWTDVPLSDVSSVRHRFGATVNDVALAAVSGGLRSLLLSRGEEPGHHMIRSLVPVSTREPGLEAVPDNRVSLMLPYLPVDVADPQQRLAAVRSRLRTLRGAGEPVAGATATAVAAYGPFPPVSLGVRLAFHLPHRTVITVTTNVPGPRQPLYGLGRRVLEMLPYVPIADRVRIGVAMFSYCGTLTFGITGDFTTVPDIDVLAEGISDSLAELVRLAG